jgi:hypothetical protein
MTGLERIQTLVVDIFGIGQYPEPEWRKRRRAASQSVLTLPLFERAMLAILMLVYSVVGLVLSLAVIAVVFWILWEMATV